MKLWIKIFFTVIIILAILFATIYLFLIFNVKPLIISNLEKALQKKVSIGSLEIIPPFNVKIRNLNIEGLLKVDTVSISPSILGLFTGSIALNNLSILKPEFTYERSAPAETTSPTAPTSLSSLPQKISPPQFICKQINIQNGIINFVDRTVSPDSIKIMIKDLNLKVTNLYLFPQSVVTNFVLKGNIPWREGEAEGKIFAQGWLNLFRKDMQATIKIEDIDGVYLYPYYSHWVDLEKARIQSAKLNFLSDIHGLNNNVTANCRLELTDIVRKPRPPGEQAEKAEMIADAVLDIFRALNQGKIVLDFTIRTRMDRPEFNFGNIKMAFEEKLAQARKGNGHNVPDIFGLPAKFIQGSIKGATDLTTAVISGTISAGKQIGKAIEESIKKQSKEKKE
ncbi:MAG: DUF748 domain-containing protein [Candidatus Omnitrophica bacterium]|nr:DUF748 domain-containing protein [Candidatus Omnitrophota bacterium]